MKLFLINVPGQPVQNAITACIFRKTHFAVYGRILNEFQSDFWGKKKNKTQTFYWLWRKIALMWKSLKQPAMTGHKRYLTANQMKCKGKKQKTWCFCICSELIWGNHRAIVRVLCTACCWFSGRTRCVCAVSSVLLWLLWWEVAGETLVQPSGLSAPSQSCFFL